MATAGLLFVLGCVLGQTPATLPAGELPGDWPPLPDFKTHVDYVGWYQKWVNEGVTDDAAPLWDEIRESKDEPKEVRQAKAQMWGRKTDGDIPGLLTGWNDPMPENYAWDPDERTDWAIANAFHRETGLIDKIIAISKRKHLSIKMSQPVELSDEERDIGWTKDDRTLLRDRTFSLAMYRLAVKALLQNAWRMEAGQVDAEVMFEAVTAGLRIAHQLEHGNNAPLNTLVAQALRSLVYKHILKALEESVFDAKQLKKLIQWLRLHDREPVEWAGIISWEMAQQLDVLQFAYWTEAADVSRVLEPNMQNIEKIQRYLDWQHKKWRELHEEPVDIEQEIHNHDPQEGLRQVVAFWSAMHKLTKHRVPHTAMKSAEELCREFKHSPETHVLLRQFAQEHVSVYIWIVTCTEASRRATQVICAIHHTKLTTGKWPQSLRMTRPIATTRARTDPFSGRYFVYRIEKGEPLLYSAGFNGKDDGGKHDTRWGWWGEESKNTDYVFWPIPKKDR